MNLSGRTRTAATDDKDGDSDVLGHHDGFSSRAYAAEHPPRGSKLASEPVNVTDGRGVDIG
jgi:hypothetical protein